MGDDMRINVVGGESEVDHNQSPTNIVTQASIVVFPSSVKKSTHMWVFQPSIKRNSTELAYDIIRVSKALSTCHSTMKYERLLW